MKTFYQNIFKAGHVFYCLLGILIFAVSACQPDEFVDKVSSSPSVLKFEYPSPVNIVSMDKIMKGDDKIVFPVELSLEEAATTTFNVNLLSDPQIAASKSVENAAVINAPDFTLPQSVEVRFGTKKVSFDVAVASSTIERNYGKNLVFAISLAHPTKSQKVDENKRTVVFSINTTEVAAASELHFLSFNKAVSSPAQVVTSLTSANLTENKVSLDNSYLTIKAQVDLGGKPARGFRTAISYNQDTIKRLITKGLIPSGAVLLSESAFTLRDVELGDYKSSAEVEIGINIDSVFARYPSKLAVAFTLSNPQKFQVDATKSTLVYLIDPLRVFTNITKLLRNTAQPFAASSIDPNTSANAGRWGVLAGWISNAQANQRQTFNANNELNGSYGSFDKNQSTQIAFESGGALADAGKPGGSATAPNITNGKIYQTISLPAGTYKFDANARVGITTDNTKGAYSIAALGNMIPDIGAPTTPANFLGRAAINGGGVKSFSFTLNAPSTVSLGFVATLSGNQIVNISGVTLTRTLNP